MPPRKIQDIIVERPGSKIPQRISPRSTVVFRNAGAPPRPAASGREERGRPSSSVRFPLGPVSSPRKRWRGMLWGAAVVAVVVLVFAFSSFFEKATLKIVPKQKTASFDSIIVARKGVAEEGKNVLPFELMELSGSESREVRAAAVLHVERRAFGTVVVYNDFDAASQRLIKNTRFESAGGKIYRIHESIVVPGQKVVDGKTVPGSAEAIVYAEEPGAPYNAGLTDFTVPGFKGTPRFAKFYARSKTEISGGFSGEEKTVSDEEFRAVTAELAKETENTLLARAHAEKPADFVLFDDAVFVVMDEAIPPKTEAKNDVATIVVNAKLYGLLFKKETIENFLAEKLSYAEEGAHITVENLEEMDFKIIDKVNYSPADDAQFSFTLKGKPQLVWEFDAENLREKLRDVGKSELAAVLVGFPSVMRAEVTFRPFWKRSFPGDTEDIVIESVLEEGE